MTSNVVKCAVQLIRFWVGLQLNGMSRREWEWEGMGMSYRDQYGNGNGFSNVNFGNGNGKDLAGMGGTGITENQKKPKQMFPAALTYMQHSLSLPTFRLVTMCIRCKETFCARAAELATFA